MSNNPYMVRICGKCNNQMGQIQDWETKGTQSRVIVTHRCPVCRTVKVVKGEWEED